MQRIYLDNAASAPMFREVIDLMHEKMVGEFGNPSSIHQHGRLARTTIEDARKTVARYLKASIGEVFFTSGGTEANNTALKCAVRDLGIQRIITSALEHHCVLNTVTRLAKQEVVVDWLSYDQSGRPDLQHLEELLSTDPRKTLVSIMHANNEIGTMIDLPATGKLCKQYNALFHSDTVQTIGHFEFDLSDGLVDFLSGSAHKFHGPKGSGFLYINQQNHIGPLLDGGSQERNQRAGTENLPGIAGMARALELCQNKMSSMTEHIQALKDYTMGLMRTELDGIEFNGDPGGHALYTVLSVNFPPSKAAELITFNLDIEGISASGGSACASGTEHASHVIASLKPDFTGTTVRFSFSPFNTLQEIDILMDKLKKILSRN